VGTTNEARVLLVEDDPALREAVHSGLSNDGYRVHSEADGTRAIDTAKAFQPALAILDVRFPRGPSGLSLARLLRDKSDLPIVFLTAADSTEDRLAGFEAGADDYLVKPFVMAELLARVRALLRRTGALSPEVLQVDDLVINESSRRAERAGAPIELTRTEFDLLLELARKPDRVLSKTQLLASVWGFSSYDVNLVEVYVSAVRRKLEEHGPRLIETVRGSGYRLCAPTD
jgi:two-component system, OmpR family, response regulator